MAKDGFAADLMFAIIRTLSREKEVFITTHSHFLLSSNMIMILFTLLTAFLIPILICNVTWQKLNLTPELKTSFKEKCYAKIWQVILAIY